MSAFDPKRTFARQRLGGEIDPHNRVGYAGKGIMRGTVAVPIRDEHGTLLGYLGITEARLPPSFQSNVVQLRPKSA